MSNQPNSSNPTENEALAAESAAETTAQHNSASDEGTEIPVKIINPETVDADNMNAETVSAVEIDMEAEAASEAVEPQVSVDELKRQLMEATEKASTYWDSLLRQKAEVENLQKRASRDVENARKYALEKFVGELLAVKDSMELGFEAANKPETEVNTIKEGLDLTLKMLNSTLEKFGIQEINPQDEKFDPQWHEAMAMQPIPNVEAGTVVLVHQKGYQLNERLLRPARVIVAKALDS